MPETTPPDQPIQPGTPVGFIGLGVMGHSMAGHLLDAGYDLHVYTRSESKAKPLINRGATRHGTPDSLASACDAVITIVGYPTDVESVYFGTESYAGLIANAKPGALLIDMTTSRPDLAERIAEAARERGAVALDAPVSGGDVGAREARLSIMVGGEKAAFDRAMPLFDLMGKTIVHQGLGGSGQHCKMCNQIAIAAGMVAVAESLAYAKASGLDPCTVLSSITGGAAGSWTLSNLAPRMIVGDFAPGFYVKHFIKDMGIAIESAEDLGLDLPGLKLAKSMYDHLALQGGEDDGTQAIYRLYIPD